MSWIGRLRNVLQPNRLSRDLDAEIATHLAERADDLVADGMNPHAAATEARRRFGNRGRTKESAHDVDTMAWLESVIADVRYAARALRMSPGFTLVAVLSLALGIGANTAIFSLTNAVALKSLPVRDPEQLVLLTMGEESHNFTNPLWEQLRERPEIFSGAAAYAGETFNLANGGEERPASGMWVSGSFFDVLGVRPLAGRLVQQQDDVHGCAGLVAMSAGYAARTYGSATAALGHIVSLDGHPFPVAGVIDPSFRGVEVGHNTDIYVPLCAMPIVTGRPTILDARSRWYLNILARPKAGSSLAEVKGRLALLAPGVFEATLPGDWGKENQRDYLTGKLDAIPAAAGSSDLRNTYSKALLILMIVVGAVLLIACANIANLLLARAAARERELAIRVAIGAGRGRLVRQLLTESLLLSTSGALLGVLFARWASRLLVQLLSVRGQPVSLDLSIDGRVLGFTVGVATLTGLLFGLAPAWRAARVDPQLAMKSGGRGLVGKGRQGIGRALVVGQVALSLALVAAAGLLLGSFHRLNTLDPGFRRDGILLASFNFTRTGFKDRQLVTEPVDALRSIRELPGVSSASMSLRTPVSSMGWNDFVLVPGFVSSHHDDSMAYFNQVSDGYFTTFDTRLIAGRAITSDDIVQARSVAVISQSMANLMFHGTSPIGRTFRTPVADSASPPVEVVGVVEDTKYGRLDEKPRRTAYYPIGIGDVPTGELTYEIRSNRPWAEIISGVTAVAARVSPAISLRFTPLATQVGESLRRPRLLAVLSAFFGMLALVLAMIGLYGTIAYSVTQRRNELGIRLALGAGNARVLRLVVGDAGKLVLYGVAAGTVLAIAGTRVVASFLFGVAPTDPATLAGAAALLGVTGLIAAGIPAWRAARVDPMTALREE